ncbi:unnamed protein product [Cuscuta epithymum]|uniref:Acid phosphatase n=1 Tax=Cuscuta epithymum TaxID=186058 RepID=A0AAV0D2B6_9ASTE|nr:unnamed protein product [Cuscuta epithymum]
MSAYGHLMERDFSAHSLSSRENSEMGSHFTMESGIYMSPFAATVFFAGLVTVGVSLVTLVITLTVMLHSCQSKRSGVVENLLQVPKSTYYYHHCLPFAMHMVLSSLNSDSFPEVCKYSSVPYITEGQPMEDFNDTVQMIENYFGTIKPLKDACDVVLMDVDDFFPEDQSFQRVEENGCSNCKEGYIKCPKQVFVSKLYMKLQASGLNLVLVSRMPEKLRNATVEYLLSLGCSGWSSLFMRKEHEKQTDTREYFFMQRKALEEAGFHIVAAISSHLDVLTSQSSFTRVFGLPSPISRSS